MNMQGFLRSVVTYHVDRLTRLAFFKMVISGEQIPVRSLTGHDYSGALTEGTYAVKGRDHRGPDEFGPVRNPFHSFSQRFRNLEGDDIEFFSFHGCVPSKFG
jgi:hypothetical protein